jgi:hypothetical protein
MLRAAFYKGRMSGPRGAINAATCWWLRGPYSHCEFLFSDGVCGSSSLVDGGVRLKRITLVPAKWDVWPVDVSEEKARDWFDRRRGMKYDLLGVAGFIARRLGQDPRRAFCAEAMAEAAGYVDGWRFDPCSLATVLWERRVAGVQITPAFINVP